MPRLLSFDELRNHGVIYGRRWVDQLEASGRFPTRVRIGARRVGWIAEEIEKHVAEGIARRKPVPARERIKRKKAG